jgi:transketolase
MVSIENLEKKVYEIRSNTLDMCISSSKGHVTSCFSCAEIMVALYYGGFMAVDPNNPKWEDRDRFVLSKGQASPILYNILADVGFFDKSELKKFNKEGGMFATHLQKDVPGVEITAGSLGHGFGLAAGMALAAKLNKKIHNVYALLGDGECYEGSIWETAMFVAHNRLANLITIIDRNYLCTMDYTENLMCLEPFDKKWESFGFNVVEIDGHSFKDIIESLRHYRVRISSKPTVIIANTVKGQGVDSLCNDSMWHGVAPPSDMRDICFNELKRKYNNE